MSEVSEGSNLDPILLNITVGHLHDETECIIAESGMRPGWEGEWGGSATPEMQGYNAN